MFKGSSIFRERSQLLSFTRGTENFNVTVLPVNFDRTTAAQLDLVHCLIIHTARDRETKTANGGLF